MKKLLLPTLVLALMGLAPLPALAQCYKTSYYSGGSYVAPAPPPRTYTTYSTYTVPSYNYNSSKSSYTAPSYNSYNSGGYKSYSGSSSSGASGYDAEPKATAKSHLADMNTAFQARDWGGVKSASLPITSSELLSLPDVSKSRYYQQVIIACYNLKEYDFGASLYEGYRNYFPGGTANASPAASDSYITRTVDRTAPATGLENECHVKAALCYYMLDKYQLALAAFARDTKPDETDPFYRAMCHYFLNNYPAALSILANYPAQFSKNASHYYYLGRCQLDALTLGGKAEREQQIRQAVASFTSYLSSNTDKSNAYLLRAMAYYRLGDYPSCISDATQQLELDHKNTLALYYRGSAKSEMKQYQAALTDQSTLLGFDNSNAQFWNSRAWTRSLNGDFAGGLADVAEALNRDSTSGSAVNYLDTRAYARFGLGQYQAAIADYTRVLALNPESGLASLMRGRARLKLAQKALACADFRQAVKQQVLGHPTLNTAEARRLQLATCGAATGARPKAPARK